MYLRDVLHFEVTAVSIWRERRKKGKNSWLVKSLYLDEFPELSRRREEKKERRRKCFLSHESLIYLLISKWWTFSPLLFFFCCFVDHAIDNRYFPPTPNNALSINTTRLLKLPSLSLSLCFYCASHDYLFFFVFAEYLSCFTSSGLSGQVL